MPATATSRIKVTNIGDELRNDALVTRYEPGHEGKSELLGMLRLRNQRFYPLRYNAEGKRTEAPVWYKSQLSALKHILTGQLQDGARYIDRGEPFRVNAPLTQADPAARALGTAA